MTTFALNRRRAGLATDALASIYGSSPQLNTQSEDARP